MHWIDQIDHMFDVVRDVVVTAISWPTGLTRRLSCDSDESETDTVRLTSGPASPSS